MKNSWAIIKANGTRNTTPKTFGHLTKVNDCAMLFVELLPLLTDAEEATEAFNTDQDVAPAIMARGKIQEMRKEGIIS